jgi:hypothetical protein
MTDGMWIGFGIAFAGCMVAYGLNALGKWVCLTWNRSALEAWANGCVKTRKQL